ncbi:MAG: T9SS type A sorting domain-containing protein [Melioribacteraceae bacterium]|nr:T9SS type A sorting domain-containing protein [Melioribacteraceae bacterium]
MRKTLTILTILVLVSFTFAQTSIKTFPVSPYMISHGEIDTSVYKIEYSGLTNVGVGDQVYLVGETADGTYAWSITSTPAGSASALDATNTEMVIFKPDMIGEYVVELTSGGETATITIKAGTWVGNNRGTCKPCHNGYVAEYEGTGHSTILTRGLEGTLSDHYAESCISCHTVGYNKDAAAVNNGFDDVATTTGWTFPEHPGPGEYGKMPLALQDLGNVQCENCHGPASEHFTSGFEPDKMDVSYDSGMCAKCHDDGHYHRRPLMWSESGHARSASVSGATRSGCMECHEGATFVALVDKTPGNNTFGTEAIGCAVCHDPHDSHDDHDPMLNSAGQEDVQVHHLRKIDEIVLTNGEAVTIGGTGKLCMNCHKGRRVAEEYVDGSVNSHFGPHHSTQTDMILGTNAITFGRYIPSSTHRDVMPNFCVTCHMAETPGGRSGFGEYGRDKIGDHTFDMHWEGDDGIAGNEDDVYNVGVCQDCHGTSIESFDDFIARADYDEDGSIESARDELHGLLEAVEHHFPENVDGDIDFGAEWSPVQKRALFNYAMVEEDASLGMHNYQFAVGLLKVSLEALEYGTLVKGAITSVADVPVDQGKKVFITWSRFGGDGVSNNHVTNYLVLRKETIAGKANVKYNGFDKLPTDISQLSPGDAIMDDHVMWVLAAPAHPAVQFFEYTVMAETTVDDIPSTFKVVGVTVNGDKAETDEVEGTSVDNLAPNAPSNVNGVATSGQIALQWDDNTIDEDFRYFAVYKAQSQISDISALSPVATTVDPEYTDTDVQSGNSYYYVVTAYDFSGNQSNASDQVNFTITGVESEFGTPDEFVLSQNYPNPFNPSTEIRFGVPENSNVTITIYNAVGKEVAVLVNKYFASGYYTYRWDASNQASGVYFYEMKSNNFRKTQKMLLVK